MKYYCAFPKCCALTDTPTECEHSGHKPLWEQIKGYHCTYPGCLILSDDQSPHIHRLPYSITPHSARWEPIKINVGFKWICAGAGVTCNEIKTTDTPVPPTVVYHPGRGGSGGHTAVWVGGHCAPRRTAPIAPDVSAYEKAGTDIGKLVTEKQAAYGDSFGKAGQIMRILYPSGIPLDKLDDALTVVRVLDKLFRIATDRDALGESPWRDVTGYALLATVRATK